MYQIVEVVQQLRGECGRARWRSADRHGPEHRRERRDRSDPHPADGLGFHVQWGNEIEVSFHARGSACRDRVTCQYRGARTGAHPIRATCLCLGNHLGRLDTAVLFYGLDREDIIMPIAGKYKHHPLFGPIGWAADGIWLRRDGNDTDALRQTLARMKQGGMLVMAPEGTRSTTGALQEARLGAAFLAVKSGFPIVPAAMIGTEDRLVKENIKHLRRSRIQVRAGPPFSLALPQGHGREQAYRQATDEIMCRIAALLPERYRGAYAGNPRVAESVKEQAAQRGRASRLRRWSQENRRRPAHEGREGTCQPLSKRLVRTIIVLLVNLIADVEVDGYQYVPPKGGLVLATNHIGILDIVMFHYVVDRFDMFIPVAEKWGERAWIRWLGRQLNFLFVDRFNPDLPALRKMIHLMEQGNALVIAPEGTRSRTGGLIQGKPGVAYLAARSGFPVMPVAITGTEDKVVLDNLKHLRRSHFTLRAGPTFSVLPLPKENRDAALQAATDDIMCHIAAMLPPRYRGVYADHPRLKELLEEKGEAVLQLDKTQPRPN